MGERIKRPFMVILFDLAFTLNVSLLNISNSAGSPATPDPIRFAPSMLIPPLKLIPATKSFFS